MDILSLAAARVGGQPGASRTGLVPAVVGFLRAQGRMGLESLLGAFGAIGLGAEAASWVGVGDNRPISGDDVVRALGIDCVRAMGDSAGIGYQEAARQLALLIPPLVDFLTPDGRIPEDALIEGGLGLLDRARAA